jgi:hypothetical protein
VKTKKVTKISNAPETSSLNFVSVKNIDVHNTKKVAFNLQNFLLYEDRRNYSSSDFGKPRRMAGTCPNRCCRQPESVGEK